MPLELDIDETKVKLPTFDEYKRTAPPKPVPKIGSFNAKTYQSKLPSINQGKSVYDDLPEEYIAERTWPEVLAMLAFNGGGKGLYFLNAEVASTALGREVRLTRAGRCVAAALGSTACARGQAGGRARRAAGGGRLGSAFQRTAAW